MSGIAIGLPVFFLIFCLVLLVPILMGVYVYRDAKQRNMNAALWMLVSILAPGFIGLIIYLIVRSEHSNLRCNSCSNLVKASFAVCPYCGAPLKEHCPNCSCTLEAGWVKCPECGEDIPEDTRRSQTGTKKDKGLKGLLLAVIIIPLALCVIMFLAMCALMPYTGRSGSSSAIAMSSMSSMEQVTHSGLSAELLDEWVEECNAAGPGAYLLKADDNHRYESGNIVTAYLLYCNNGYYIEDVNSNMGGWFTDATAAFQCFPKTDDDQAIFYFFEYIGDEPCDAKVLCDGKKIDAQITEVDWSYFSGLSSYYYSEMCINVLVDKSVTDVYSIGCDFYTADGMKWSDRAMPASGDIAAGSEFFFAYSLDENDDVTHAVVTAYDIEENQLISVEVYLDEFPSWEVSIMTGDDGSISCKAYYNS